MGECSEGMSGREDRDSSEIILEASLAAGGVRVGGRLKQCMAELLPRRRRLFLEREGDGWGVQRLNLKEPSSTLGISHAD